MANETALSDSILESVKKDLGASEWDDAFDDTLIRDINSVFMILFQLGVGPSVPYTITGSDETWADFSSENNLIEAVRSYVPKKVKLMFDPSSSSFVNASDKEICAEMEWRLNVAVDPGVWT